MIVTSIRVAQAADRRLTIRELIERFDMGYGTMHRILAEDLQMLKVILSYKFDFYMMHVEKVTDHSYNIMNRHNQFSGKYCSVLCRNFEQLQAGLSHSMDNSGKRMCSNSRSIVIAVVSSAKDNILRSKQTVVCLEDHTLTSQNQRLRAPGSH